MRRSQSVTRQTGRPSRQNSNSSSTKPTRRRSCGRQTGRQSSSPGTRAPAHRPSCQVTTAQADELTHLHSPRHNNAFLFLNQPFSEEEAQVSTRRHNQKSRTSTNLRPNSRSAGPGSYRHPPRFASLTLSKLKSRMTAARNDCDGSSQKESRPCRASRTRRQPQAQHSTVASHRLGQTFQRLHQNQKHLTIQ